MKRGRGTGEWVGGPLRRQLLGRRLLSGGDSGVFSPVAASSRFPQATAAAVFIFKFGTLQLFINIKFLLLGRKVK